MFFFLFAPWWQIYLFTAIIDVLTCDVFLFLFHIQKLIHQSPYMRRGPYIILVTPITKTSHRTKSAGYLPLHVSHVTRQKESFKFRYRCLFYPFFHDICGSMLFYIKSEMSTKRDKCIFCLTLYTEKKYFVNTYSQNRSVLELFVFIVC